MCELACVNSYHWQLHHVRWGRRRDILSHKKQTPPCAPGIQEHVEISTKKKGTQSENEDGTNSFGVHIVKPF